MRACQLPYMGDFRSRVQNRTRRKDSVLERFRLSLVSSMKSLGFLLLLLSLLQYAGSVPHEVRLLIGPQTKLQINIHLQIGMYDLQRYPLNLFLSRLNQIFLFCLLISVNFQFRVLQSSCSDEGLNVAIVNHIRHSTNGDLV